MSDRLDAAVTELAEALRAELLAAAPPSSGPERLLSIDEAATVLSIGRSLLYAQIGAGQIRSFLVGRRRLVPESAIAQYIAAKAEGTLHEN